MILISQAPGVVQLVLNFCRRWSTAGFTGDTAASYADRLTMSTDNEYTPAISRCCCVSPHSTADHRASCPSGGGPTLYVAMYLPLGRRYFAVMAGAKPEGIIVDMCPAYMNRIIEINSEEDGCG